MKELKIVNCQIKKKDKLNKDLIESNDRLEKIIKLIKIKIIK